MDPRSSNRQKVTTGNSKGVHKRGEGRGTESVNAGAQSLQTRRDA